MGLLELCYGCYSYLEAGYVKKGFLTLGCLTVRRKFVDEPISKVNNRDVNALTDLYD